MEKTNQDNLDERLNVLEELIMKTEAGLDRIIRKKKQSPKNIPTTTTKKNHPLHFLVEKDLIENLRIEAKENGISVGELCRRKLRGDSQLDRIEMKIDKLRRSTNGI